MESASPPQPIARKPLPEPLRTARALAREVRTLTLVAPMLVRNALTSSRNLYQRSLPVQKPTQVVVPREAQISSMHGFRKWLGATAMSEGEDSIYLAPEQWRSSSLSSLALRYPQGCGLKISKNGGGIGAPYLTMRDGRRTQQQLSGSHSDQLLTFNFLHLEGIAPRLVDLIEIVDDEGACRVAYVVSHVGGGPPTPEAFVSVIEALKSLKAQSLLHLVAGGGWRSIDFDPPDGNGNVISSEDGGRSYYVDVHNFTLGRYDRYIESLAKKAASASHFGNTSMLLGGAYLYQEVPGVALPAKRSPAKRFKTYDRLFEQAGLDVAGKAVVDVGCNLGLMGAEHLRRGAAWLHGFDLPEVTMQTERILLAIGCTRFSLTPTVLGPDVDLLAALPDHIRRLPAEDLVVNYLAIREHVGWLPALKDLNWRYMVYEGHQRDKPLQHYISELNRMIPVRVVARGDVSDANTRRRDAAIIERLEVPSRRHG
jgi:hypothetical protein